MRMVRIDIVTSDDRAGDLMVELRDAVERMIEDGDLPMGVVAVTDIRSCSSKAASALTRDQRDELEGSA